MASIKEGTFNAPAYSADISDVEAAFFGVPSWGRDVFGVELTPPMRVVPWVA